MKQKINAIILLLLAIIWLGACDLKAQDPELSVANSFESGNKAFEAGQFTSAMKLFEDVYEQGKFSEGMLYRLAFMHENLRNYPQAIYYLKKSAQEFGEKGTEGKIRQLMQRQGSTRFFSVDGWNGYLSFFRAWGWLFLVVFGIAIAAIIAHYMLPRKQLSAWRQLGIVGAWATFLLVGLVLFHRAFLVPNRAVLMDATAFYSEPGFAANHSANAFSLGETLEIQGKHDIWIHVAAGGREWWVPNWVVKEL